MVSVIPFLIKSDDGRNEEIKRENNGNTARMAITAIAAVVPIEISFSLEVICYLLS
jgi:hypothetical protein